MDTDDWVVLATFSYRHEAEVVRGLLESHELEARIHSDDLGGLRPALSLTQGVQLLVRVRDLYSARQLLASADEKSDE